MRNRSNISYFSYAFMTLIFMGAVTACVNEDEFCTDNSVKQTIKEGLSITPTVSESSVIVANTRTDSDEDVMEKQLNTLDVFVEHITEGTGDGTFIKQYHLLSNIVENDLNLLANNWRDEELLEGHKYNIYVAVNNPLTKETKDLESFNVDALKALTYNENKDDAIINEDGTFKWVDGKPAGDIYKLYSESAGTWRALTSEKEFMMDGVIPNWEPVQNSKTQVFDVTLNRAAAKFVLNAEFGEDFLNSLTKNADGTEKPDKDKVFITGSPAWKFNNFAFGAHVFDPGTSESVEVHNSDFNIFHNEEFAGESKSFQIITYSYPNVWEAADYANSAPSLIVSVPFSQYEGFDNNGNPLKDDEGNIKYVTTYTYYRVPLVKSTVTSIDRNKIYVINATISARGSDAHEDVTPMENLYYEVLPWNDETNSAAIHNEVQSVQHYYFKVNPKVYTLRGDGDQSVILTYLKAAGTKVNWKLFTYAENGNQTGVVANDADGATRAWFYNASGAFTTTYSDNESGVNWSNTGPTPMGVNIVQSTEGTSGSSGTVTVTSHALNNRAIKYIRLRVYLDEEATFINGKESMYEDIIIRHFPTDNIQNIYSSWSSYHDSGSGTTEVTLTTFSLVEAEAWKAQYGVNYTTKDVNVTDYISYAEYNEHAGETGYTMTGPTASTYNAFNTAIQTNANRRAANSQANAIADAGEGHIYYWGTNAQQVYQETTYEPNTVAYYYDFDYYTTRQSGRWTYYTYYKYSNYYTATYTHTHTQTQYSMTVEVESTGNWVDWDRDQGKTYNQANVKYTRSTLFTAKVYNESESKVYAIEPIRSGSNNNYQYKYQMATSQASGGYNTYYEGGGNNAYGTSNSGGMTNLTNNHMYVIQISSTSAGYIMGRPILGNPNANLSQDDVVSPAFMIASQLGATSTTDDNQVAATHCSRYMEVAKDGTRYTGWRLPTPDEIGVITRYQQGTINGVTISNSAYQAMTPVLTGRYYWSLTGNAAETSSQYSGGTYLRCVRDLSAAEVEAINGFDKIIEKYQGSGN